MFSGLFGKVNDRKENVEQEEKPEETETNISFNDKWGWFIPLFKVAGNDWKNREYWLDSTIIDFLNQLSFLTELEGQKIPNGRTY